MIFFNTEKYRKKDIKNLLFDLLDNLSKNKKEFNWRIDDNTVNSKINYDLLDDKTKPKIIIGTKLLKESKNCVPHDVIAGIFSSVFHEYEHFQQCKSFQKTCKDGGFDFADMSFEEAIRQKEVFVSMLSRNRFGDYYNFDSIDEYGNRSKYGMVPFELQAEIAGIEGARAYFEAFDKNFDFDAAINESIQKSEVWFGPKWYTKEGRPPKGKEIAYLEKWAEEAYCYPCRIFDSNFVSNEEKFDYEHARDCASLPGQKQYSYHLEHMKSVGDTVPEIVLGYLEELEQYHEKRIQTKEQKRSKSTCPYLGMVFGKRDREQELCKECEEDCEEKEK